MDEGYKVISFSKLLQMRIGMDVPAALGRLALQVARLSERTSQERKKNSICELT
jgi:hypothetical protein